MSTASTRILNAGQPTAPELRDFQVAGVKTVINLRAPEEDMGIDEPALCAQLGLEYVNIPVAGPQDLTQDTVAHFHDCLQSAQQRGDVLVHCGTSNRVGAMLALESAWHGNADRNAAIETGKRYGLSGLQDNVEALLTPGGF